MQKHPVLSRATLTALFGALIVTFTCSLAIAAGTARSPFKNLDEIADRLALATYAQSTSAKTVKIAILDNGFKDRDKEIGKTLPASTVYHAGPVPVEPQGEEAHGLIMAQIVSGLLAKTPNISYELHLFSAFGYSNLQKAIQTAINDKFDIVLYSQVWEYGGNGDGKGFINALVNQATAAGIVWINAAGNFGDATYRAPVETLADDWAYLPSPNRGVRVRCYDNPTGKCQLRAVLSWNDFKDDSALGTDKDLDLVLSDDTLKIIRTGGLQQVLAMPAGASQGYSLYPREIVEAELKTGVYELRVKVRSKNFTKANDELRIVTSGDYLEQLDTTPAQETLLAPADNATVLTIGASDSPKSGQSLKMGKPEFSTDSKVILKNGDTFKGSSNSAAMSAALAVIAKALNPTADRATVLAFLSSGALASPGVAAPTAGAGPLTLSQLQFQPTGPGCFRAAILPQAPEAAAAILRGGAVTVETTVGLKIMIANDPFTLGLGVKRTNADDMLVVSSKGFSVRARNAQRTLPAGAYEVVQLPQGASYCPF